MEKVRTPHKKNRSAPDTFGVRVKVALAHRRQTVTNLAAAIGYKRNTVSIAIHASDRAQVFHRVRDAIRKELHLA